MNNDEMMTDFLTAIVALATAPFVLFLFGLAVFGIVLMWVLDKLDVYL